MEEFYSCPSWQSGVSYLASRFMLISMSLIFGSPFASAMDSPCKFKITTESGQRVAVAQAESMRQNGQMQFRLSTTKSGGVLEVRFRPLAVSKRRSSPNEVIELLNDGEAQGSFGQPIESLNRIEGWKVSSGTYFARFKVSQKLISRIGTGFLRFDFANISESRGDIDPDSSVNTSGCANIIQSLGR